MKKSVIDQLCEAINKANKNCTYPQRGHLRYADIKGDGRRYRTVYVICNDEGGVCPAHNGATPKQTAANLRSILNALTGA